jgi:hypothetical protein
MILKATHLAPTVTDIARMANWFQCASHSSLDRKSSYGVRNYIGSRNEIIPYWMSHSMINKSEKTVLLKTLELANVANPSLSKIKVLEFSHAEMRENKRVRDAANHLILNLMETNDLGTCIHITGEMRALTDPFHRQICEEMRRRGKGSFYVLFHIPYDRIQDAASLVEWNLSKWSAYRSRLWQEELRTIDLIANRSVNLLAYNNFNDIQYSVFGNKYILLQEKHNAKAKNKRVWLLESEDINGILEERGRQLLSNGKDVNEGLFRDFTLNLSGVAARRCLSKLEKGSIEKDKLLRDPFVRNYAQNPQDSFNALKIMDFIVENADGLLSITPVGREFLNSY